MSSKAITWILIGVFGIGSVAAIFLVPKIIEQQELNRLNNRPASQEVEFDQAASDAMNAAFGRNPDGTPMETSDDEDSAGEDSAGEESANEESTGEDSADEFETGDEEAGNEGAGSGGEGETANSTGGSEDEGQ